MSRSKQPARPAAQPPLQPPAPASTPVWLAVPPAPDASTVAPVSAGDDDETLLQIARMPAPKTVPSPATTASLVIVSGEALLDQREFSLQKQETKIGRKEAQNDIVIKDPEVSRSHASITRQGQQYLIQDLNSTLGTLVNGVKLKAGPATLLRANDEIAIGSRVIFKFRLDSSVDDSETLTDIDFSEFRAKFEDKDPFRTQYDD